MTSLWLGTKVDITGVYLIAEELDFRPRRVSGCSAVSHWHKSVGDLRLQIGCNRGFFPELADIIAATIEFDDLTDCFPYHPAAVEVLKQLYENIPDLVYTKPAMAHMLKPAIPLSQYLKEIEK